MTKFTVNVQIVLTFDVPYEADTFDTAAEQVERMGDEILEHVTIGPGDIWVNSVKKAA